MYIIIAFILGIINVISKSINYKATEKLGSLSGSFMNYFEAAIISAIIIVFLQYYFTIQNESFYVNDAGADRTAYWFSSY